MFGGKYKDYNLMLKSKIKNPGFGDRELELLSRIHGDDVYEIGTDFGDRLIYLKENGVGVVGGMELNPNFHAYGARFNKLHEYKFNLDILPDLKLRRKYKTIYSYKFLDNSGFTLDDVLKYCDSYIAYEECLGGIYEHKKEPV